MRVDGGARDSLRRWPCVRSRASSCPDRLELVKGAPGRAPRAPRPGRGGPLARPRGDARRLLAGARAAQRARRPRARRSREPGRARHVGRASSPATGSSSWQDRREAIERSAPAFSELRARPRPAGRGGAALRAALDGRRRRRPRAELAERRQADLDRGFTTHGPHRDDLELLHGERVAAHARLAGPAAGRPARAAVRRARRPGRAPRPPAADAARRRDVGARRRAPRAARGAGALRRAGGDHRPPTPTTCPGAALAAGGLIRVRGRRRERRPAGGGRVRRLAPRGPSLALEGVVRGRRPTTLLARVQAVWADVAGPGSRRRGHARYRSATGWSRCACESAVWAQELELLGPIC